MPYFTIRRVMGLRTDLRECLRGSLRTRSFGLRAGIAFADASAGKPAHQGFAYARSLLPPSRAKNVFLSFSYWCLAGNFRE